MRNKPYLPKAKWLLLLLVFLVSTGCWDMRDIDNRSIVTAMGIDQFELPPEELGPEDQKFPDTIPEYEIIVEIPLLGEIGGEAGAGGGGGGNGKPAMLLSSVGTSPAHANALYQARVWRTPFYGHTQVLVIGEEVARENLKDVIDFIDRHPEVSRRLKLVIANGKAKDVLKVEPQTENLLGPYLSNLLNAGNLSGQVLQRKIGEALRELSSKGNGLLPRVRGEKTEAVVGGSAVIKNWKLIGWLGEMETYGARFIIGSVSEGTIVVGKPRTNIGEIGFMIENSTTSVEIQSDSGDVKITVSIETEGDIVERFGGKGELSPELLLEIQQMLEDEITKIVNTALSKLQQEFRVDVVGLGEKTRKQQPKLWKQLESDWDTVHFPGARVSVKNSVNVRRIGVVF